MARPSTICSQYETFLSFDYVTWIIVQRTSAASWAATPDRRWRAAFEVADYNF